MYHSMANLPSRLVHAAVKGEAPQLRGDTYAEDGGDSTYVKDCGRGVALLMLAGKLNHQTYNVASGRATTAGQMVEEIQKVIPGFKGDFLKEGANPNSRSNAHADISRLQADTPYEPQYHVDKAIPDYIAWLRAGNPE
jgi:UDP-glucose 4-epimerase